jgi:hypothetical protein
VRHTRPMILLSLPSCANADMSVAYLRSSMESSQLANAQRVGEHTWRGTENGRRPGLLPWRGLSDPSTLLEVPKTPRLAM